MIVAFFLVIALLIFIIIWKTRFSVPIKIVISLLSAALLCFALVRLFVWGFERGSVKMNEDKKMVIDSIPEISEIQKETENLYDKISVNISERTVRNDTTFFYEETGSSLYYHSIYIETDRQANTYDQISDFRFDKFDDQTYYSSLEHLSEKGITLTKRKIKGLPAKWIILRQYEGRFYAYKPCDFMAHYRVAITDSAYIDYTSEGPLANKIENFQKINNHTFRFTLIGVYPQNRTIIIHLLDNHKAVFEEIADNESRFYLMANAEQIRQFPLIVNRCEGMKQGEFEFEKTDIEKLLGKK